MSPPRKSPLIVVCTRRVAASELVADDRNHREVNPGIRPLPIFSDARDSAGGGNRLHPRRRLVTSTPTLYPTLEPDPNPNANPNANTPCAGCVPERREANPSAAHHSRRHPSPPRSLPPLCPSPPPSPPALCPCGGTDSNAQTDLTDQTDLTVQSDLSDLALEWCVVSCR